MLEEEMAGIIKFVLDSADNPTPYYWSVPEGFAVPSIYFPVPEIVTEGDTFSTYGADYSWGAVCMHKTTQEAYALAFKVLTALKVNRNGVPVIGVYGDEKKGIIRIKDPDLKVIDTGTVRIDISWTSRRPYSVEYAEKMRTKYVSTQLKDKKYQSIFITKAMKDALAKYDGEEA